MKLSIDTQKSIDVLLEEMRQALEKTDDDKIDILNYILDCLPAVVRVDRAF